MICIFAAGFVACKQAIENPESLDPVYADLGQEVKVAQTSIATAEKDLKEAEGKLKAAPPRDSIRGQLQREIWKHQRTLVDLRQKEIYFRIRQEQRRDYDRVSYLKAFEEDKPWPDPADAAEYKRRKRLQLASRNWEDRVPKSTRYQKPEPPKEGKGEKKAEGGGHEAPKH